LRDGKDFPVVESLRAFLDHEISRWYKAGESEKIESRLILKVSLEDFEKDLEANGMNSRLADKLGWNYSTAARLVEQEKMVFLLTVHPKYQALPFSFKQVCDNDDYALHFVRMILSVRGGEIVFEDYDPLVHVPGVQFHGVSDV
jgi:hypothetical protein